ncbi:IucA/IucC family C-terminal-domain containing protein [Domibacillus iocasae]|uniref:Aerobactin siderophore biosynthesis IucA/IucC-like C-terminal domain-containing protein n=1 Tax=Domibacillus iocasae TaxID=1714016 RepID=A0A1E7DP04_9BACI|nr:IucA/IucC family C-terminal-domain containing protein [Domibacillus iocasae]OES44779.1 hypothetical protein BA724_05750 [Domibacillus iocasae]
MSRTMRDKLKSFHILAEKDQLQETPIIDLLHEETCLAFLQKQKIELKAPSVSVAASMISKRYAYLVVASTLYSMIEFNSALRLPLHACALSKERNLCIKEDMCYWHGADVERAQWREAVLCELFSEHITPVLSILGKTSRIPESILWENVAVRINSIYRKTLSNEVDLMKIERLKSDFYFLKHATGELFNLNKNPIGHYLKIGEELTLNPYRKTCCMYYKLKEHSEESAYCGNCPIIKNRKKNITR